MPADLSPVGFESSLLESRLPVYFRVIHFSKGRNFSRALQFPISIVTCGPSNRKGHWPASNGAFISPFLLSVWGVSTFFETRREGIPYASPSALISFENDADLPFREFFLEDPYSPGCFRLGSVVFLDGQELEDCCFLFVFSKRPQLFCSVHREPSPYEIIIPVFCFVRRLLLRLSEWASSPLLLFGAFSQLVFVLVFFESYRTFFTSFPGRGFSQVGLCGSEEVPWTPV